jgi:DNA replication protein DnaC
LTIGSVRKGQVSDIHSGYPIKASAALDRLLHRADVINIKGDSYGMRKKRHAGLLPGAVALDH